VQAKHKAWALLCNMQDRADKENPQQDFQLALAECWDLFKDSPGLQYAARYERARSLHQAGKVEEARKNFRELHEATLKEDRLPPIDEEFRRCMQVNTAEDPWSQLVNRTAEYLIEKNHRPAVLALAGQVWSVEDQPLAQNLLTTALAGKVKGEKEAKERLALTLAVIEFLAEKGQVPQADGLLQTLLAEPKLAERSDLWRLAATLADRRDMPASRCADGPGRHGFPDGMQRRHQRQTRPRQP
jgi:predicted Zn-dependent protease